MSLSLHTRRWIVAIFLLAFTIPGGAGRNDLQLRPFSAEYSLSLGYLVIGRVTVALRVTSRGHYEYQAHTLPVGLTAVVRSDEITELSRGDILNGKVIPKSYHYRHLKSDNSRQVDLRFHWDSMQVTNRTPESEWIMKIEPGTQDKFSQQLMLMLALQAGQREISFPVADGGRLKRYRFRRQPVESVETKAGTFRSLHLIRSKQGRNSQADFWLAADLDYLPVKVQRREKEGAFTMQLLSIRWDD